MINIKTLAAALALTVAGAAHASCTYHFRIDNQLQEKATIFQLVNYRGDGSKYKFKDFKEKLAAGEVRDFSTRLVRKANTVVRLAVTATEGEVQYHRNGAPMNVEEFKASSSESCYTSGQKKQAGNPVTITIK